MARIDIWRIAVPPRAAASREARSRWVWPRARAALGDALGCAASSLRIRRDAGVKPCLASPPGWSVSLSHSGDFSLLALARQGPIGIDHEALRPLQSPQRLACEFFGADAEDLLVKIKPSLQIRAFYAGWVNLEALLKATGEGFAGSGGRFEAEAFRGYAGAELRRKGRSWRIAALPLGKGYCGAIAYPARLGACELKLRDLESGRVGELRRCG